MKPGRQLGWLFAVLLCLSLVGGITAQDQTAPNYPNYPNSDSTQSYPNPGSAPDNSNPANDPPARVARIQYISGEVSMQPGGVDDWVAATLNRPLTTSDRVWTDKDSRAELNVGTAFIRMSSETSMTFNSLGDNSLQVQLDQGTLELTVRHLEPFEIFEIDTPNLAFSVMEPGVYRIDVPANDNQTLVTVRKGHGQATGSAPAVTVSQGQQVRFTGQGTLQNYAYAAPQPDGFEDWSNVRDRRLDGSQSAQYVAPGTIGYQDLDYYGSWRTVPQYGAIWTPASVPAGWAPYRNGHWVWVAPWGWTWVDDAPWGFAPFHYGRWVFYGGAWGWAPGPVYVGWRPYYAPALVGWVGGGGWGFNISFGFGVGGGCGWFPLGWGEAYYPWYHGYRGGYVSQAYIRNVNVTNTRITNITNVTNNYYNNRPTNVNYVNRNVAGAVTGAPKSALINGQNIARYGRPVSASELGNAQTVRNVDVTPTRQSMLGGTSVRTSATPPRTAMNRPVITHNQVPQQMQSSPARVADSRNMPTSPATNATQRNPATEATNQTRTPVARPLDQRPNQAPSTTASVSPNLSNQQHAVPKPPYAGGHAPSATESMQRSNPSSPQSHVAAPPPQTVRTAPAPAQTNHNGNQAPKNNNRESAPKENKPNSSMNAPQQPYLYHGGPSNNGSAYARGNSESSSSPYYGASRNSTPSSATYSANRGYSQSAAPAYRTGGYSSAPTYRPAPSYSSAPSYRQAPTYSARSVAPAAQPHYSAPSGGGGGNHGNSSGGRSSGHNR
jgi:hypothetical protein